MRKFAIGALLLAGMSSTAAIAKGPVYSASIVRTSYGIPHITASSWRGIGYGVGYAYAQDNLCMLAEEFATVAGERSLHFGPKESAVLGFERIDNLSSDTFFRSAIDLPKLRRGIATQGCAARDVIRGYVAGYNRLLRELFSRKSAFEFVTLNAPRRGGQVVSHPAYAASLAAAE